MPEIIDKGITPKEALQKKIDMYLTGNEFTMQNVHRIFMGIDNLIQQALQRERGEMQAVGRIFELEILEAHIEKQLSGYDTVRINSLLEYIDKAKETAKSLLSNHK